MDESYRKRVLTELGIEYSHLAPASVREIGYMVADFLKNMVADAGTCVDTGFGFGEFDCYVKVADVEHIVVVKLPKSGE